MINYWDSLLRSYPAGLMMVHSAESPENSQKGRDKDDHTCDARPSDFQLFDGQQRIKAILLGLAEGLLAKSRRLWIDIGKQPNQQSGLIFQLRISSAGQPFGYQPDAPNSKFELKKRTQKWNEWETANNCRNPVHAFQNATGRDLIDAICAVPFADICNAVREGDAARANRLLREPVNAQCPDNNADDSITDSITQFVAAAQIAMNSMVIAQKVDENIVNDQHEYVRFFTRLGQGGTRLSDDELTYSIIKHHYPMIHDRIRAIMDKSGRLGGEVDLVLGALRVAKTLAPWQSAKEWEIIGRPNPAFVEQLALDENLTGVEGKFAELIPLGNHPGTGLLEDALLGLRRALSFDATQAADTGFPAMLLARLPRDLLDVLMLLAIKRGADQPWPAEDRNRLRAFVLYWLLFVRDDYKAAWLVFRKISDATNDAPWHVDQNFLRMLIEEYEREEIARVLPRIGDLQNLKGQVDQENAQLLLLCYISQGYDYAEIFDRVKYPLCIIGSGFRFSSLIANI